MPWRGFLKESKSFMGYDNMTFKEKIRFWIEYPRAYYIFYSSQLKAYILYIWYKHKR